MAEESKGMARPKNYRAIVEMSETPGWAEITSMLEYDVKFASGLCCDPKPQKDGQAGPQEWVVDPHAIGVARGIKVTAKKYLDLIKCAKRHTQKGE